MIEAMKKNKANLILIFFLISASSSFAQTEESNILAKMGSKVITVEEFKSRYELSPQIGRNIQSREEYYKLELLYSMIAEKLWALEAENVKLDTTDIMNYTFKALEKMYWRDALYRKEIIDRVNHDPNEFILANQRAAYNLLVKFLYAERQSEIDSLYQILQNGFPFDLLLAARPEAALQDTLYVVSFGKMDEYAEDALYSLKQNEFTSPIKSPEGWYIFKLDTVVQRIITDEGQARTLEKDIRRTVDSRATDKVYNNFYRKFFKGKNVNVDGELFWSLSEKVAKLLEKNRIESNIEQGGNIHLLDKDFFAISKEFGPDSLEMPFIKFDTNPVTLRQFLHEFVFEGFYSNITNPDIIRAKLNARIKTMIEQELLNREARQRGLHNLPEVQNYVSVWRDNYLGTLYKREILREVKLSDDDVYNYYSEKQNKVLVPTMVNISELLTDSLEVIEMALNELDKGAGLKEIAVKHTKRSWVKQQNGETGFFPVTAYGEIGRIAGTLEIGEIYGPIKVDEGYSLFQLLDKKEEQKEFTGAYEEIKEELAKQLSGQMGSNLMVDRTVELANKYGLTIDENLLKSVKVNNLNTLVYKYIGFGGRILAVPFTNVFAEWINKWIESKESLP